MLLCVSHTKITRLIMLEEGRKQFLSTRGLINNHSLSSKKVLRRKVCLISSSTLAFNKICRNVLIHHLFWSWDESENIRLYSVVFYFQMALNMWSKNELEISTLHTQQLVIFSKPQYPFLTFIWSELNMLVKEVDDSFHV